MAMANLIIKLHENVGMVVLGGTSHRSAIVGVAEPTYELNGINTWC